MGAGKLAPEIPPFNHSSESRTHDFLPVLTHCDDLNSDAGNWATTAVTASLNMQCMSDIPGLQERQAH